MSKQGIVCAHIIVILILCACITGCRNDSETEPGSGASAENSEGKPVYLESARRMTFASILSPSGNVQAKNSAYVSARIPGTLDRIFVDEGDRVIAGETDLFQGLCNQPDIAGRRLEAADLCGIVLIGYQQRDALGISRIGPRYTNQHNSEIEEAPEQRHLYPKPLLSQTSVKV